MTVLAVYKVRLDVDGYVTDVEWGIMETRSKRGVGPATSAPVADVVEAIQRGDRVLAVFPSNDDRLSQREFAVVEFDDGTETIELSVSTVPAPGIRDMLQLDDNPTSGTPL